MISSGFNKSITIEKEVTSTNALGTPTETYSFLKETWANMRVLGGNTQYTENSGLPFTDIEFTLRYDPRINYDCRILCDGNYYKIKHLMVEGRKDYIRLRTIVWDEEIVNSR